MKTKNQTIVKIKDIDKIFDNWYKTKYNNEEIKFKDILTDLTKKSLKSLNEIVSIKKGKNKQIKLTTKFFRNDKREYIKNYEVSSIENKLYFETSLNDIEIYKTKGEISLIKDDKQNNKGIFVPKGSILQSKVRPYQKNFIQFFNEDILVSSAFLIFYNSNQNINNYVYNIFNSFQYNQYVINKQDTSGTYPTIDFDTWNDFEINIPNKIEYITLINDFFTEETDNIHELTKTTIEETKKYKDEFVSSIFNQNNISNIEEVKEQQNIIFDNWKNNFKNNEGKCIIQLEKERNNIGDEIEYENIDINDLNFNDIEYIKEKIFTKENQIKYLNYFNCGLQVPKEASTQSFKNTENFNFYGGRELGEKFLISNSNIYFSEKDIIDYIKESDLKKLKTETEINNYKEKNKKRLKNYCIKNDILISFRQSIKSSIYNLEEKGYVNQAVDIIRCNNKTLYTNYLNLQIEKLYISNSIGEGQNLKLNNPEKENIEVDVPKELSKDNLKLSSYQLQQIIAKFIEDETDSVIEKLNELNNDLSKYKEELLYITLNNKV